MASVNKVILLGNLGRDPEMKYLDNGDAIANLAIATSEQWKDKNSGEKREATEWHRVTAFGKLAEIMGEYLKKGSQVYIEGSLRTRKYTDKDGVERYSTEIRADLMKMLGSPPESKGGNDGRGNSGGRDTGRTSDGRGNGRGNDRGNDNRSSQRQSSQQSNFDDDIPF